MKNFYKFITLILSVFLFSFVITSCNDSEDKKKQLPEEEVIANFDTDIKDVSVSKDSINEFVDEIIEDTTKDDVLENLKSLSVPNTKVTLSGNGYSFDNYLWQDDDVIYARTMTLQTYKLDLSTVYEVLDNVSSTDDLDYVSLIENYLPADFDLDKALAKIKFSGEDFTYDSTTGYFTLKTESLYTIVGNVTGYPSSSLKEVIEKNVSTLDIKIGYDGYNFTGYYVEVRPQKDLGYDVTNTYVTSSLNLTYNGDDITGGSLKVNFKYTPSVVSATTEETEMNVSVDFTESKISGSVNAKVGNVQSGRVEGTATFEVTENSVSLTLNGTTKSSNDTTSGSASASSISVSANITDTEIKANVSVDNTKVFEILGTINNNQIVSANGTIIINDTPAAFVLTTENVVITDEMKYYQASAIDITKYIFGR